MINRIHSRHDRQQDLGGADVARGLFSSDVLLTGLQREAQGGVAGGVFGDADDSAWHSSGVFGFGGHVGGVGAAEAHGDAEALRAADGDVRAQLAGGLDERKGEDVGGHDDEGAGVVSLFDQVRVIDDSSVG